MLARRPPPFPTARPSARRPMLPPAAAAAAAAAPHVWALDFDGVTCDSVGESAVTGWNAAARQWPALFADPATQALKPRVLADMRAVRPVVETGYENVVQVRCLVEGVTAEAMLAGWGSILPAKMKEWALDRAALVSLFGTVRDEWMSADLDGWLAANGIYEGLPDILRDARARHHAYIVTTKQAHFTAALLANAARVPFPDADIFSQTVSGAPKTEVLAQLRARHPDAGGLHFVEDKLSTLEKVAADPAFDEWRLYLVDWGYNTAAERARAAAGGRVRVVSVGELAAAVGGE